MNYVNYSSGNELIELYNNMLAVNMIAANPDFNKELSQMDIKMLEETLGQEVTVALLNQLPVKGRVAEISDNFIKVESPSKNLRSKINYINKNMIVSITIK